MLWARELCREEDMVLWSGVVWCGVVQYVMCCAVKRCVALRRVYVCGAVCGAVCRRIYGGRDEVGLQCCAVRFGAGGQTRKKRFLENRGLNQRRRV